MLAKQVCGAFDFSGRILRPIVLAVLAAAGLPAAAQTVGSQNDDGVRAVRLVEADQPEMAEAQPATMGEGAEAALPDAPVPQQQDQKPDNKPLVAAGPKTVPATTSMRVAPMYSRVIPAGVAAPQIHKWDKVTLAARDLYSVNSIASFFVSAGWGQLTNGQPNYGTNSGAFGQRLGAAAIRDTSEAFLSNGPFAVWLHQDPRYFALGPQHSIPKRAWYAVTRALITRDSSDGHAVVNTSLILGQAAGTALNNFYYPQSNRNFHDNVAGFGGSMGGAALSFVMDEFMSDLLKAVRLRHQQRLPH
jgi:hypothetical protein